MKILVIGLGSMGRRRIRLIKEIDSSFKIAGVDMSFDRRNFTQELFDIDAYETIEEAINREKFDCVFVCSSPLSHCSIIEKCLELNMNIFTELNLVSDGYDRNSFIANERGLKIFLSSTFLYREEIVKIQDIIKSNDPKVNYIYHVGQYLPDWHPWENYKNFFVNDKRTNGCREIFAIELPWMVNTFGDIKKVISVKGRLSNLELNYPDNYMVVIEHENGSKGTLIVDVVSRKAVRNLEVYNENLHMRWDGTPTGLYSYDINGKVEKKLDVYDNVEQIDEYSKTIVENAYKNEIIAFFDYINNNIEPIYSFSQDAKILDIIDAIEEN